ncbi:ABC transporter permease [Streptomyces sp. 4N509B]|uniref:ABC transporter permease n=1 Tax=Streptomyces sp. 4N509B TaxID=3457413 RepID=UPI003FD2DB45
MRHGLLGTGALGRVVRSGVSRRRVQTVVIALATTMAVASAVVAGSLMVAASAPFDRAFASQHGAHLTAQFDPDRASEAELDATGRLAGVTASAGPFPSTTIRPVDQNGGHLPALTLVGRDSPHADVDELDLTSGRWPTGPGEIVLSATFSGPFLELGTTLNATEAANSPTLTVVGFALSATRTATAWATAAQVTALASADGDGDGNGGGNGSADTPVTNQMLYRLDAAGTKGRIADHREAIAAAVPSGALLGTESWLDARRSANRGAAPTIPFLMAFGVLGIVMSVIIVGSVISGAVGTSLRRIGVLKAIGFTPREVVRAYVAQAMIPAVVGVALGVALGNVLAMPLLEDTGSVYGTPSLSVAWWVNLVVPAAALLVVGVAALVPALRAGRLRTVEAIAVGRAPRTGRGQWAHRAAGRLPLPRAVSYGLASPFAHPVRTLAMLLAVAFGTVTATFAMGLTASLSAVGEAQDPEDHADVTAISGGLAHGPGPGPAPGPPPGGEAGADPGTDPGVAPGTAPDPGRAAGSPAPTAADPAEIRAAVEAQAGTASYYGRTQTDATVAGVTGTARATLYQGDSRAGGYAMIAGHWLTGAGQVVVPSRFLEKTGTTIGDTVRVTVGEDTATLRIVGEAFDTSDDGLSLHATLGDFPSSEPDEFLIEVEPGVSATAYAEDLAAAVEPLGGGAMANSSSEQESTLLILQAMAALLTLMLVSVAGLGVLNSVVLDTRERVHDLGVCKALGMTPRQTVSLVLASVVGIGVLGGLLGVPAGFALHDLVVPLMGEAAGTPLPSSVLDVYEAPQLALLALGGIAIAALGALPPATWAARSRTATALRTE